MSAAEAIVLLRRIFFAKGIFAGLQARRIRGMAQKRLLALCLGRAYAQNGLTPAWKSAEGRRAQRDLALAGSGRPVF